MTGGALARRYQNLLAQRQPYESLWQELADYILPRKSGITYRRSVGTKRTENLFDGTSTRAAELLASSMMGSLTSPSTRWFSLKTRNLELNRLDEVQEWLEYVTDAIYLALQQSNFGSEVHETYLDLCAFGTGCVFVTESEDHNGVPNGLRFKSFPLGSYAIAEGIDGRVNTIFVETDITLAAAYSRFGDKIGEKNFTKLQTQPDELITVVHAVFPREQAELMEKANTQDTYGQENIPLPDYDWDFLSFYFLKDDKQILSVGGFYEMPYLVIRYLKATGEIYGRGPGHTALPDIRSLNKTVQMKLEDLALALRPPLIQEEDAVIGAIDLTPAGVTILRRIDQLRPLPDGRRYDVVTLEESKLQSAIKASFYSDLLELYTKPNMTATEVQIRMELMQRLLGPTLGRLEAEFLRPLIDRCFAILYRQGHIPPPPQVMLDTEGGTNVDVEYEGPLAKVQKSSDVAAIERTVALLLPLAQLQPTAIDVLDIDKIAAFVADVYGLPATLRRSDNELQAIREQRMQEAQEAKQKENLLVAAEITKKLGNPQALPVPQGPLPNE